MSTDLAPRDLPMPPELAERVLVHGDLSKLSSGERLSFYKVRCESAGLDMRGRPFEFITLQGKLTLYAKKECAEQLNRMHGLSHEIVSTENSAGLYEVRVRITSPSGRTAEDVGIVVTDGLRGADLANARMKAVTKAKRRATLSFCGLGDVIDETELDTVEHYATGPNGQPLAVDNRSGHGRGQYASLEQTQAYLSALSTYLDRRNQEWLDQHCDDHGNYTEGCKDLCNRWQADNHLLKWCHETGRLSVDPRAMESGNRAAQIGRYTAIVYHRSTADRKAITQELRAYMDQQAARQTEAIERSRQQAENEKTEDEIMDDLAQAQGKGDAWEGDKSDTPGLKTRGL